MKGNNMVKGWGTTLLAVLGGILIGLIILGGLPQLAKAFSNEHYCTSVYQEFEEPQTQVFTNLIYDSSQDGAVFKNQDSSLYLAATNKMDLVEGVTYKVTFEYDLLATACTLRFPSFFYVGHVISAERM